MLVHEKELKNRQKSDGRRGAKKGVRRKNEPAGGTAAAASAANNTVPPQLPQSQPHSVSSAPSASPAPSHHPAPPPSSTPTLPLRLDTPMGGASGHFAAGALTPGDQHPSNNSQDHYGGGMVEQFDSGNTSSTIVEESKLEPRSPDVGARVGGATTPGAPPPAPTGMPVFPPSLYPMWPFGGHS